MWRLLCPCWHVTSSRIFNYKSFTSNIANGSTVIPWICVTACRRIDSRRTL